LHGWNVLDFVNLILALLYSIVPAIFTGLFALCCTCCLPIYGGAICDILINGMPAQGDGQENNSTSVIAGLMHKQFGSGEEF
jgi:hypothetical protein